MPVYPDIPREDFNLIHVPSIPKPINELPLIDDVRTYFVGLTLET